MHETKPIQPKQAPDILSVNPDFENHEKFIKEEIEKGNVNMKPCGDYPYKKMGVLS